MKEDKLHGLEALQRFYGGLDEIPVPALSGKVAGKRSWRSWGLALAPIMASACAYTFLSFCASDRINANEHVPSELYRNQLLTSGMAAPSASKPEHRLRTGFRTGTVSGREV